MVVLLVGMAITAIWMTAALPAWRQQTQRQREEDLIFRGEQYARAIMLFQDKNQGANPPSIDVLVSQHFLRKKWKDPITNDEFVPVGTGAGVAQPGQSGGQGQQGGRGGGGSQSLLSLQGPAGITGVRSKSEATSIKIYQNQQQYNLWPFDAATIRFLSGRQATGGAPQQGGRGVGQGQGGRGGQGVGGRGGQPGDRPARGQGPGAGGGRGGGLTPPPTGGAARGAGS